MRMVRDKQRQNGSKAVHRINKSIKEKSRVVVLMTQRLDKIIIYIGGTCGEQKETYLSRP